MKKIFFIMLAVVLVLSIGLIGCTGQQEEEEEEEEEPSPVKIGLLLPLTGLAAGSGVVTRAGIELALDQAGWEVAGKEIELIVEDTAFDASIALDKARKLIDGDEVDVLIGPITSAGAYGVADYATEKKVPNLSILSHANDIVDYEYMFALGGTLKDPAYLMGRYVYEELGYRTVTTIGVDFVAGYDYIGGFVDGFEELGGEVIQQQWTPYGTLDFSPYIVALEEADAVVYWVIEEESIRLVQQCDEYGVDMPLLTTWAGGAIDEFLLPQMGDLCLGIKGVTTYCSLIGTEANEQFVAAYEEQYGERPFDKTLMGYRDILVVLEALKATEGDTDPEVLSQALLEVNIDDPAGGVSFDPTRFGIMDFYVIEVVKVGDEYLWEPIHTYPEVFFGK